MSSNSGSYGDCPRFFDTAHRHAQVLGLDDDKHPSRPKDAHQGVSHLGSQPLLHLGTLGVALYEAHEL
jgi:hypothetical protein